MRHLFKQITRLALLALTAMLPQLASAYDFMVDGLAYNINSDGTSVTVTSGGNYIGAVNIPSTVTNNGITYSVTSIGERTFYICSSLTSVTIPNSVTSIGNFAFYECSNLTSVTIPNSVTSIGNYAFRGTGLTSVTIPKSVTSIGSLAFYNCNSLTSVNWNAISCADFTSVPFQTSSSKIKTFTFGSSVQIIPKLLCKGLTGLTSISLPTSVTEIRDYAFQGCTGLTSVSIPNSVTSIGDQAFEGCTSLTSMVVESGNTEFDSRNNCNAIIKTATNTLIRGCKNTVIPNSVTSIGQNAFGNCIGLTSVEIPNSVTEIHLSAFSGCSGLTSVTIPNSVTSIGVWAFRDCSDLTSVTLSNSLATIPGECFDGCSSLTSIEIPNSVTMIYWNAFSNCSGLTSIVVESGNPKYDSRNNCNAIIETMSNTIVLGCKNTIIPNSVTSIGRNAFGGCIGLTTVTIPSSVTSIVDIAFNGCTSLNKIYCLISEPITINENVFSNYNADLYVPAASVSKYNTKDPWMRFNVLADNLNTVTSIALDTEEKTLNVGESFTLTPTLLPETAVNKSVTWSSSDATVASVDTLGNVTALKRGTATIIATTNDGSDLSASCVVTVLQPVTGITVNEHNHTLKYNGSDTFSFKLTASTTPSNANTSAVQWTSSNENIATVSSDGTVTSAGKGVVTITATTTDGSNLSDSCIVTVEQLVTEITLDPQAKTLNVGESFTLSSSVLPENANDKSVTWSSSNTNVASVDTLGNVTALRRGSATITATTKDGSNINASSVVTVLQPVTGISLNENSYTLLYNGQQFYLFSLVATATPSNANNKNVTWTSSNESVAAVNNSGVVTSQGLGTAIITATTTDGSNLSDSCVVTVNPVPTTSISLDKAKEAVVMGNTVQITGTVDEAAYIKTFNWTSSNDAVASVDQNGLVRGVGVGTVSITATTIDGSNLSASCIVQVLYPSNAAGAGDVNEDGRIDITDATLIVSYLQGNYPMAVLDEALMDVNGDGDINMSDVLRVISLIRND